MLQIIGRLIGVLVLLAGVIGDQNEATSGFKILGAILAMVGGLIVFFC